MWKYEDKFREFLFCWGFGGGEGCAHGGLDLGEELGGGGGCVCRGMRGWLTLGGAAG